MDIPKKEVSMEEASSIVPYRRLVVGQKKK
jgi:hypothetical protein